MTSTKNIAVGSPVWVEQADVCWIDGEVVEIKGDKVDVQTSEEKKVSSKLAKIYPRDTEAPDGGVDDMTRLSYLHEPGVLQNLAARYALNKIYTYTGNILIAVNPFQSLPYLYDADMMADYTGAAFGERSPHVFAIADIAYRAMVVEGQSNSILVSGESGAGKTETTKMLMRYLAYLGGRSATEGRTVEQQVLESNPVLEAFGNAKTVRNNNSSRFGKFVELQFDKGGRISGAAVRTYLLERSRVCQISDPERNYHCFYLICAAPKEITEKYKLGHPKTFHYLNQSSCFELVGVSDAKDYLATRRAMDIVGISKHEQDAIFRVVAAILHVGNIDFGKGADADSSVPKDDKSKFHLKTAAELLMCDPCGLEDALCKRVMITPEEVIKRSLDTVGATVSRDGLAKTIYSRLFDWLVTKINISIGQDPNSKNLIGVLDIYGFESFKTNSFEQFCINFTNEKLQQHFNQHVFKMEQEDYKKDEIEWSYIDFIDNQDVLDLIEKKPGGIIALLDEACMFPKSTHETFSSKLYQTFVKHKRFIKPKLSQTDFTISHYAGEVLYQSDHFLDKNKDYVVPEHQDLLSASKCSFVVGLFPPIPEETTKSSKFSSIGSRFKLQLQQLMETLNSTEPHYIRCVKPNNLLKPAVFENVNVMQQLRCGGVLEAIRISCAGYPTRRTFSEFISRFKILVPEAFKGSYEEKDACIKILKKNGLEGYQVGKTKVFLRAGQMAVLNGQRGAILGKASKIIQKYIKTYIARKKFINLRKAAIDLQTICRARVTRNIYEGMRRTASSIKIQRNMRKHLSKKAYNNLQASALSLQRNVRAAAARKQLRHKKQSRASTTIQAHWRGHYQYKTYYESKRAVLISQSRWRGRLGRKELKKLKTAAKESGALKEAKDRLEKKVAELTTRVQFEKQRRDEVVEEKDQEIEKLQKSLEDMQKKVAEANSLLALERENARKSTEAAAATSVTETPTPSDIDTIKSLTAEVDKLKALLQAEKERADELQKKSLPSKELSNEDQNNLVKEQESSSAAKEITVPVVDTEKVVKLTDEIDNLKVLLQAETERADELQAEKERADGRCFLSEESSYENQNNLSEEEPSSSVKESTGPAVDTEKFESLTDEIDNLKALLKSERVRADDWQIRCLQAEELNTEMQNETPNQAAATSVKATRILAVETERIEFLIAEVHELKASLQSERERADEWEKKCLQESSNGKQNKPIEKEAAAAADVKEAPVAAVDTEKIKSVPAEVDELKAEESSSETQKEPAKEEAANVAVKEASVPVVESEKVQAHESQKESLQAEESSDEMQNQQPEESERRMVAN